MEVITGRFICVSLGSAFSILSEITGRKGSDLYAQGAKYTHRSLSLVSDPLDTP